MNNNIKKINQQIIDNNFSGHVANAHLLKFLYEFGNFPDCETTKKVYETAVSNFKYLTSRSRKHYKH